MTGVTGNNAILSLMIVVSLVHPLGSVISEARKEVQVCVARQFRCQLDTRFFSVETEIFLVFARFRLLARFISD